MIPPKLVSDFTLFQASVEAAQPVDQASSLTKAALLSAGRVLLGEIEADVKVAGRPLDAADPTGSPTDLVSALLALSDATSDAAIMTDLRGFGGRIVFNLAQA